MHYLKKAGKGLMWSVAGLSLLLLFIYLSFPFWIPYVITQSLHDHGMRDIHVKVDFPGSTHLGIPSITFEKSFPNGELKVSGRDIHLTYSLETLLSGAIGSLVMNHVNVQWIIPSDLSQPALPSAVPPQGVKDWNSFSNLIRPMTLPSIPIRHIRLNHMNITHSSFPKPLQNATLKANVEITGQGWHGTIQFLDSPLPITSLTFEVAEGGKALITSDPILPHADPPLYLETRVSTDVPDLTITGTLHMDLGVLIQTLGLMFPIPNPWETLTGTLKGHWDGRLSPASGISSQPKIFVKGSSSLKFELPSLPPYGKDLSVDSQWLWEWDTENLRLVLQPSSNGSLQILGNAPQVKPRIPFLRSTPTPSLNWDVQETIHATVSHHQPPTFLRIHSGRVRGQARTQSDHLEGKLTFNHLTWDVTGALSGKATLHLQATLSNLDFSNVQARKVTGSLASNLTFSPLGIRAEFPPGTHFRAYKITNNRLDIPLVSISSKSSIIGDITFQTQSGTVALNDFLIRLPGLTFGEQKWEIGELRTKGLQLGFKQDNWFFGGLLSAKLPSGILAGTPTPKFDLTLGFAANPATMNIQFDVQTPHLPLHVKGKATLQQEKGLGKGTLRLLPIQFAPPMLLSRLLKPRKIPGIDITGGVLSAHGEIFWDHTQKPSTLPIHLIHAHGIIHLQELEGFLYKTIFKQLTSKLEFQVQNNVAQLFPSTLRIQEIQSPITFTDISCILASEPFSLTAQPRLHLRHGKASLLGGRAYFSDLILSSSIPDQSIQVTLQDLDLGKILELEQKKTITGSGKLDGTIPLHLKFPDVEVHKGQIQAQPPGGVLHFDLEQSLGTSWAQSQPQIDLLIQSLKNFHYHTLTAGVDYQKNGTLNLTTRLEGQNPHYKDGIPFNFNVNIEENIPALLKTLSLMKDLQAQIEEMITPP